MRRAGFTLIELMIVVAIIGILCAIAIPSFARFHARSKRSEVRMNLKAAFTVERAYFAEKDTYTGSLKTLGFAPERGNRFAYVLDSPAVWVSRTTATDGVPTDASTAIDLDVFRFPGATPQPAPMLVAHVVPGANGKFMFTATGNIDADPVLDSWSISSVSRTSASSSSDTTCLSGVAAAGEPCGDRDDL